MIFVYILGGDMINFVTPEQEFKPYAQVGVNPYFSLMLHQTSNAKHLRFESLVGEDKGIGYGLKFFEFLKERTDLLKLTLDTTVSSLFKPIVYDGTLSYELLSMEYSRLIHVRLQNFVGLKAPFNVFIPKVDEAFEYAKRILDQELPALCSLIAELSTDRRKLESTKPIQSLAKLKVASVDIGPFKNEFGKLISDGRTADYVNYGESYYSNQQFKDCEEIMISISTAMKKMDLSKYGKEIEKSVKLIERLTMRIEEYNINPSNIELYSKEIERVSNNVAFAGAVIHIVSDMISLFDKHRDVIGEEIRHLKRLKKA